MSERILMLMGFQMHGFVMKTGACPQEGDLKNMLQASMTAFKLALEAEPEARKMQDDADALRKKAGERSW
jgi:hypothetical protein